MLARLAGFTVATVEGEVTKTDTTTKMGQLQKNTTSLVPGLLDRPGDEAIKIQGYKIMWLQSYKGYEIMRLQNYQKLQGYQNYDATKFTHPHTHLYCLLFNTLCIT